MSSHALSIVTTLLSMMAWLQCEMQILIRVSVPKSSFDTETGVTVSTCCKVSVRDISKTNVRRPTTRQRCLKAWETDTKSAVLKAAPRQILQRKTSNQPSKNHYALHTGVSVLQIVNKHSAATSMPLHCQPTYEHTNTHTHTQVHVQ